VMMVGGGGWEKKGGGGGSLSEQGDISTECSTLAYMIVLYLAAAVAAGPSPWWCHVTHIAFLTCHVLRLREPCKPSSVAMCVACASTAYCATTAVQPHVLMPQCD